MRDSPPAFRALLVEDSPTQAAQFRLVLEGATPPFDVVLAGSLSEATRSVREESFDLAFVDLLLPDSAGLDTIEALRSAAPNLPLVVLTRLDDSDLAQRAVHEGAQDYLVKEDASPRVVQRTATYAIERAAFERRRLDARDRFLGHVSHEIGSPLAAAYSALEMLLDGDAGPIGEDAERLARIAYRSLTRLKSLTADLLDSAAMESGQFSLDVAPVDLAPVIRDAVESMQVIAAARGLDLRVDASEALPNVSADAERVTQVVLNLLRNAVKYTEPGGSIVVSWRTLADQVEVSVADTGRGIDPEDLERVFERSYQADEASQGVGFGLHISREIVERHGGQIRAESEAGQGSVFRFTIPSAG